MDNAELEKILEQPIYATDFQYLIGDIEGFLDISE